MAAGEGMLKVAKNRGVGVSLVQMMKGETPAAPWGDGAVQLPMSRSATDRELNLPHTPCRQ
jgi:hypothetical protein